MPKKNLLEKIPFSLDLATEPVPGQVVVEVVGNGRVLIENHIGITEYGCNEISVKVNFGFVHICGSSLKIARMSNQRLIICGCIEHISLQRRK